MLTKNNTNTFDAIYQFDGLIQRYQTVLENPCEETFLKYVLQQEKHNLKYIETVNECKRLQSALDNAQKDITVLNSKLQSAKRILDLERMRKKRMEFIKNAFIEKFDTIRRMLMAEYPRLPGTVQKFVMSIEQADSDAPDHLSTIVESECTFSMTNASCTRSEDDLDESSHQSYKKHRVSEEELEPVVLKKRRPSQLSLSKGNENVDSNHLDFDKFNNRKHDFIGRNIIMPERCILCEKKLRFGQMAYKCSHCHATSHEECRKYVPLPCVPMGTPTKKGTKYTITDLAPNNGPKIPACVIHLIKKIEQLGLHETGLYRIPGNDREVKNLSEKFHRGKGVPSLESVDIHTMCGCLKDLLRNLVDPLIPQEQREIFSITVADKDTDTLRKLILSLPEANRHTLSYLILHLQRVAANDANKMSIDNLATVFAPTIVGYSEIELTNPLYEAQTAIAIMSDLLELSSDFWNSLLVEIAEPEYSEEATTPTESRRPKRFLPCKSKRFFASPMSKF